MDSTTGSSSSDEDVFEIELPRPRNFRDRNNPIEIFNEIEFLQRYRFSKEAFTYLVHYLNDYLKPKTQRNRALDTNMQLAIALRFYATGAFQILIGDQTNVSKSSACRIIRRVSECIARHLLPEFIKMPEENEFNEVKMNFHRIGGFPGVIACIDCTHVRIESPGGPHAELYRNRKSYFSVNVQAACTANLKVVDLVARWRGSVHDSTIFNNSRLRARFENGEFERSFLLGDSGYPCRNYLLTPLLNPSTEAESRYNIAHIATRNSVERCFGVVKRRFPCLGQILRTNINTTMAVICATFTLHNIAIELNEDLPFEENDEPPMEQPDVNVYEGGNNNNAVRNHIINTIFQ